MSDTRRPQAQQRKVSQPQTKARASERQAERPVGRDLTEVLGAPIVDTHADAKQSHGLQMEEAIATVGRAGEHNITVEKFWVPVDGHLPAGFNVGTLPGHGLEVVMEQRSYLKTYAGTGTLKTGLTPIVPIGTKGRILVTDTTTGETLEQPWTWHSIGGGSMLSRLWRAIKGLIWKG